MANPAPGFQQHPGYTIELADEPGHVQIRARGVTLVDTRRAVHLREQRHVPVLYVPLADMDMSCFEPTDTSTYCPFKGHARYWNIRVGDELIENAVWNYPQPYDEMLPIADYASFYIDRVDELLIDGQPAERKAPGWTERK